MCDNRSPGAGELATTLASHAIATKLGNKVIAQIQMAADPS